MDIPIQWVIFIGITCLIIGAVIGVVAMYLMIHLKKDIERTEAEIMEDIGELPNMSVRGSHGL